VNAIMSKRAIRFLSVVAAMQGIYATWILALSVIAFVAPAGEPYRHFNELLITVGVSSLAVLLLLSGIAVPAGLFWWRRLREKSRWRLLSAIGVLCWTCALISASATGFGAVAVWSWMASDSGIEWIVSQPTALEVTGTLTLLCCATALCSIVPAIAYNARFERLALHAQQCMALYCPKCDYLLLSGSHACPECGARVRTAGSLRI